MPRPDPVVVSLEQAYREACLALGEAIVRERLLLQARAEADKPKPEPEEDTTSIG